MQTHDLSHLLGALHAVFPLAKSDMGPAFRGTHSITQNTHGMVQLNVWWLGRVWPVTVTEVEINEAVLLDAKRHFEALTGAENSPA